MPSIEIIAIDQRQPTKFDEFPFAVMADGTLRSHRSPSRFQSNFDQCSGILYHVGNPDLKTGNIGRCFFAHELLSQGSRRDAKYLEFAREFRSPMATFLAELMRHSPAQRLAFTTDWQFGPDWTKHQGEMSLDEFWHMHGLRQIELNALYPIVGG